MSEPVFEFVGNVSKYDEYGRKCGEYPVTVRAADIDEATEKVRAATGATFDSFRQFWSRGFSVNEIREVEPWSVPSDVTCQTCGTMIPEDRFVKAENGI